MGNYIDVAKACWRLQKWVDSVDVDRKMAAESSLRTLLEFLKKNNIEIVDLTGKPYDEGLSVDVMYFEDEESQSNNAPFILEMMSPIILKDGNVLEFGQVVLAKERTKKAMIVDTQQIEQTQPAQLSGEFEDHLAVEDLPKIELTKASNNRWSWAMIPIVLTLIALSVTVYQGTSKLNGITNEMNKLTEKNQQLQTQITDANAKLQEELTKLNNSINNGVKNEGLQWKPYEIQPNDSLSSICKENGLDYYAYKNIILAANGINNPDTIMVGQVLILPVVE